MLSVILPVYNGEKYLSDCIKSVLNQKYSNFEFIIINDGSKDSSENIIKGFKDNRINYFYQENAGVASARNHGIRCSTGDIICFIDQDDIWESEHLERIYKNIYNEGFDMIISNGKLLFQKTGEKRLIYEKKPFNPKNILFNMVEKNFVVSPSQVGIKRNLLINSGMFNEHLNGSGADDWDLWIRVLNNGAIVGYDEKPTMIYRYHESNNSYQKVKMGKSKISVLENNKAVIIGKYGITFYKQKIAINYLFLSYYCLLKRRMFQAMKYLTKSLRNNPFVLADRDLLIILMKRIRRTK